MSGFIAQLRTAWRQKNSLACVGLDPQIERLPAHIAARASPIFQFNKAIIDATADLVCAYKPQFAHYAACEAEDQLERTIEYIHRAYPGIPVILDAKRGDVGSTAERYAIEVFERYGADAVDRQSLSRRRLSRAFPALRRSAASSSCAAPRIPAPAICRIWNVGGRKLFVAVAELAARRWNTRGNCLLVVGATYPRELAEVRAIAGNMPFLLPGVGAQGGRSARRRRGGPERRWAPASS